MVPGQIPVRGSPRPVLRLGGPDQASAHWTMAICVHSGYFDNWQPSNLFLAAATYPVDGSCGLKVVSRTHTAHKSGGMRHVIAWAVGTHACTISDGAACASMQPAAVLVSIQRTLQYLCWPACSLKSRAPCISDFRLRLCFCTQAAPCPDTTSWQQQKTFPAQLAPGWLLCAATAAKFATLLSWLQQLWSSSSVFVTWLWLDHSSISDPAPASQTATDLTQTSERLQQ